MSDKKTDLVDVQEQSTEIAELSNSSSINQLIQIMPEHKQMLEIIKENHPEIQRATSLFGRTQSQFMDNMLTVTAHTPLRNARQVLAEMNKTREAIKEATIKLRKKEVELRMKRRELANETDDLKREMLELDIVEILTNAEGSKVYISGAIRKLTNYTEQFNAILKNSGKENFTEEDFEKEEEEYHIMKAFDQAVCAARSRGGLIDEGNHIYLTQIGINGSHAQAEVSAYLKLENELINAGKAPTHQMYMNFLKNMVTTFKGNASKAALLKGMTTLSKTALVEKGDQRLLLSKKKDSED